MFLDFDQGRNLSYVLDVLDIGQSTGSDTAQIFKGVPLEKLVIESSKGWDAIPGSGSLANLEVKGNRPEYRVKDALEAVTGKYDYVVIDTPPGLGIITINVLTAADKIIIPAHAAAFSLQGVGELSQTLDAIREHTNPSLSVEGILLTEYKERSNLTRGIAKLMEDTAQLLGTMVFDTRIWAYKAHGEAQAEQESIFEYAPRSEAAADYATFIMEFLGVLQPNA